MKKVTAKNDKCDKNSTGKKKTGCEAGQELCPKDGGTAQDEEICYRKRLEKHHDELRWLYMEIYDNGDMFAELLDQMKEFYRERKSALKGMDETRERDPGWYRRNDMLGMILYIDNFAGNMKGVESRLDYIVI